MNTTATPESPSPYPESRLASLTNPTGARGLPPVAALAALCLILGACGKSPTAATAQPDATSHESKPDVAEAKDAQGAKSKEDVTLTEEELTKLGVSTQPAQATEYREETIGYGMVLEHQPIAQALADAQTAEATARFSKASLSRARDLRGTPGAVSADVEQTAEQKAAVDSAALMLTTDRLSSTWGLQPPWKENFHDSRVASLARGTLQLIKVTFPLGALLATPADLHGGRLGTDRSDATAKLHPVWPAPADTNIPGRSFFALFPAGTLAEGERLQVWAATGQPVAGVVIPTAAIVLTGGKYWCYVEKTAGNFQRVPVDTGKPVTGGYVVSEGVNPGDRIAVTAVAQLLAKETGSTEEPD